MTLLPGAALLQWQDEALQLLPQRALWWPRLALLAVADMHLGKAATFRAFGVPVPSGTTADNLASLDALLAITGARRLAFLGDLLHARAARAPATLAKVACWRQRHASVDMLLVRGNHDLHAGDPPENWDILCVHEPHLLGSIALRHLPGGGERAAIAGHLHPVYRLRGRHDSLRLPAFVLRGGQLILPAFGAFTGGMEVSRQAGDRIFVTDGEAVHALPEANKET